MYGLPSTFKSEFLDQKTLEMVCFTQYVTYLHLSDGLLITVEGELSINDSGRLRVPSFIERLYPLIDQKIRSSAATTEGTISLQFENGWTLLIYDSSPQFESYSIAEHGETLVRV